jgi:putative membrane protein
MDFNQLFKRWLLIAVGVFIASYTASGIHYDSLGVLVVAVLLLSVFNVFLKPLLMLFSLPFIVLTFGLGVWVINALLFLFVSAIVQGFYVDTFMSALWGALVLSVTSAVANVLFAKPGRGGVNVRMDRVGPSPHTGDQSRQSSIPRKTVVPADDDVIDI